MCNQYPSPLQVTNAKTQPKRVECLAGKQNAIQDALWSGVGAAILDVLVDCGRPAAMRENIATIRLYVTCNCIRLVDS